MHTSILTVVFVLCVGSVGAQETEIPRNLTLEDALRIAVQQNPTIGAARSAVDIADSGRLDATRRLNPAITVASEGFPVSQRDRTRFFNNQTVTARVDQEFETAGRRRLRTAAADVAIDIARARLADERRRIELQVRRTYFLAVLAKADREVAKAALDEIDNVINLNRARFEKGEISGGELRRIQVERLKFVDDVFAADLAFRNARSAVLALLNVQNLGQDIDTTASLADGRPANPGTEGVVTATVVTQALDVPALRAEGLVNRPDLAAARGEQARADTETRLQRALRTPNITLGAGYQRDFGSNAVVFGATIPLPLFNRNPGGIARALAERRAAEYHAAETSIAVSLDVQQAANAVEINRARVAYIEREYLKSARESRDIVLAAYRLGTANLIDYLDAQRAFRDTVRTYNRALYDERISMFELAAATGTLPPRP